MSLHPLEDNFLSLKYAIEYRLTCNQAWKYVTGERLGTEVDEQPRPKKARKKITPETKKEIIRLRENEFTYKAIGDKLGYSDATIATICLKHEKEIGKHELKIKELFTFEQKLEIVEMRKTKTLREVAEVYNTTKSNVIHIERRVRDELERRIYRQRAAERTI